MFKNYKISPDERKLFSKSNSNDLDKNNLKGKVKTVIAVENKIQDKTIMQFMPFASRQLFEISNFNKKGEMLEYKEVYKGNILYMKKEYLYDENENLKEENIYDEENEIIETVTFKHNSIGQMIEEFREDYDILLTAFYNENGQLEIVKDKSELQGYGEKTFIIKREETQPENISEIETIQNDKLYGKSFYKYDSLGNVIMTEHRDEQNDLISSEFIEYDTKNNISKLTVKDTRRTTEYSYDYNYDSFENWINSKFYVNGELNLETIREIEYY
jgi:hypothetical protein